MSFIWSEEDSEFSYYYTHTQDLTSEPSEEEWAQWLKKALQTEAYHLPGERIDEMVSKGYLVCDFTKKIRGKVSNWQNPYQYGKPGEGRVCFQVAHYKAYEACEQGFIRRRDRYLGRKRAAYLGPLILVPGWVIATVNDWIGTQFNEKPLPSGKPRPVLRQR